MFETSRDILNLILAVSIAGVSVFICLFLYYIIMSIKRIHDTVSLFHNTLESFNDLVDKVKKKLKDSSTHLKLIGMLVAKIAEEIKEKTNKKKTNKARKIKKTKSKK